jgi:Ca2+:H+ antiporter
MAHQRKLLPTLAPAVSLVVAVVGLALGSKLAGPLASLLPVVEFLVLLGAVFAAVHHADVIAHRTGEPYGTLVLTVAVTIIEVALILSIMFAGDGSPYLARDTVLAVIMIVCNGLVGICVILGGLRYGEQGFRTTGASAYLVVLMPLATLTLILPNYTTSIPGPYYSTIQLAFVSVATLTLYGAFLYVQTVRHRDYFLSDDGDDDLDHDAVPDNRALIISAIQLLVALTAVVLLAKVFAKSVDDVIDYLGAPAAAAGILVAGLVLLPESLSAIRAARLNRLQKSLNLALGSSLATIGLTIPAVAILSIFMGNPLALGLSTSETVLVALTLAVSLITFGSGRTNILPGFVHLVLFATFIFLVFAP